MGLKLGVVGAITLLLAVLLGSGCFFGGDDDGGTGAGAILRRGSIPTATPPANLPEPIVLGQTQAAAPGVSTTPAAGGGTYVVKSGDTLGAVATSLGIPQDQQPAWIADVLRLNGIEDVRLLRAGQELTLPRGTTAATAPTTTGATAVAPTATRPAATQAPASTQAPAATATPSAPPASGGGGSYTVVQGDNPVVIGLKLGVPSGQLAAWSNELLVLNGTSSTGLSIGQVLQLPASTPR